MSEEIFSEDQIPYEELARFGVSRQRFNDLPQEVQRAVLRGRRSPVIPINVRQGKKLISVPSCFRFVQTEPFHLSPKDSDKETAKETSKEAPKVSAHENPSDDNDKDRGIIGVLFVPRIEMIIGPMLTPQQQSELYAGRTVRVVLPELRDPNTREPAELYCQIDPNTDQLRSIPAKTMDNNIRELVRKFNLNSAERYALVSGKPIAVFAEGQPLSLGIDLRDSYGIRFCGGDTEKWKYEFYNNVPSHILPTDAEPKKKYHFASSGCWLENEDGTMDYVPEEHYDQTILDELQKQKDRNLSDLSRGGFSRGR